MPKKAARKSVATAKPLKKRVRSPSRRRTSAKTREAVMVDVTPHPEEGVMNLLLSGTKLVAAKLWEHRETVIGIVGTVIGELIAQKAVRAARRPRLG